MIDDYLLNLRRVSNAVAARVGEYELRVRDAASHIATDVALAGVGKSYEVSRRAAATWRSLGTRAFAYHATELIHGDLGAIAWAQPVVLVSASGRTRELLDALDALESRECYVVAVTPERSPLGGAADLVIEPPATDDPYGAPMLTCVVQAVILDLLVIAHAETTRATVETLRRNHPGGVIGAQL